MLKRASEWAGELAGARAWERNKKTHTQIENCLRDFIEFFGVSVSAAAFFCRRRLFCLFVFYFFVFINNKYDDEETRSRWLINVTGRIYTENHRQIKERILLQFFFLFFSFLFICAFCCLHDLFSLARFFSRRRCLLLSNHTIHTHTHIRTVSSLFSRH